MEYKSLMILGVASMLATACAREEVLDINPDPVGNAISFNPSVGHSTRAVETDINNLGDFYVYAKGLHSNGNLFQAFLIGYENDFSDNNAKAGDPELARFSSKGDGDKGYWNLWRNVYWPADVNDALFWAFTTLQKDKTNEAGKYTSSGEVSFTSSGPEIAGFSPVSHWTEDGNEDYNDGSDHTDLVVAFKHVSKGESTVIPLNFDHALSQIEIKAKEGDGQPGENRMVYIKGAWIYAHKTADLSSSFSGIPSSIEHKKEWTVRDDKCLFGSRYSDKITLTKDAQSVLSSTDNGSLMLVPQTLGKWENTTDSKNTSGGAYIMLLCRIELVHSGDQHNAAGDDNNILGEDGKHYHQQFPEIKDGEGFDRSKYGYACVPVDINWQPGKKYTYILNICGASSGAGVYPPGDPDKPGQNILTDPISFEVTVSDWEDYEWKEGETGDVNM